MAYASCKPSPAGVPASPPLLHSPPVVAQETSSLLLEEGLPGAQRTGDGGQRGPGRDLVGPGQNRWPRKKSAGPVAAPVGRRENLGEEGTGILGLTLLRNHWKCYNSETIKVAGAETADSDRSEVGLRPGAEGQRLWCVLPSCPHSLSGGASSFLWDPTPPHLRCQRFLCGARPLLSWERTFPPRL